MLLSKQRFGQPHYLQSGTTSKHAAKDGKLLQHSLTSSKATVKNTTPLVMLKATWIRCGRLKHSVEWQRQQQ